MSDNIQRQIIDCSDDYMEYCVAVDEHRQETGELDLLSEHAFNLAKYMLSLECDMTVVKRAR